MIRAKDLAIIESVVQEHVPDGYEVFVFGSRVRGGDRKYSDIDIGIKGKKRLEMRKLGLIKAELEESMLPYRIDVVDFKRVGDRFRDLVLPGEVLWIKTCD